MKKVFERKEMKFILSKSQAKAFVSALKQDLVPDIYPDYGIHSIYYDSADHDLFHLSEQKPLYKERLRLRSYTIPQNKDDPVFFEVKKKLDGIVYKRRTDMNFGQLAAFPAETDGDASCKEVRNLINRMDAKPFLYVFYHRQAWTWKDDPELRITLDDDLQYRDWNLSLDAQESNLPLFDSSFYILEIKSVQNLPLVLVRTLERLHIVPASVSKASAAFKKYLERNPYEPAVVRSHPAHEPGLCRRPCQQSLLS